MTEELSRRRLNERARDQEFYLEPNLDFEEFQILGNVFALPAVVSKEPTSKPMDLGGLGNEQQLEDQQPRKRPRLEGEYDASAGTKRPAPEDAATSLATPTDTRLRDEPALVAMPCIPQGTFQAVRSIPRDPRVDPPDQACFRCWDRGHRKFECPNPHIWLFCHNCGRREVSFSSCPRCAHPESAARTSPSLAATTSTSPPANPGPRPPPRTNQQQQQQQQQLKKKIKRKKKMKVAEEGGPPKPPGPKFVQASLVPTAAACPQAPDAVAQPNGDCPQLPVPVARNHVVVPSAPGYRITNLERTLNLQILRAANVLLDSLTGAPTAERTCFRKLILTFLERNLIF